MTHSRKSVLIFGAMLAWASIATLRADEEKPDVPVGYEQAGQAGEALAKPRKQIVVPAVPAADDAEQAAEDKLFADPQMKAVVDQMRPLLEPLLAAELTFAKIVCKPNEEQFRQMKSQAVPELEKVARTFAKQQAPMMGVVGFGMGHRRQKSNDIYAILEMSASRIVSDVFPKETVAIYQDEQNHRKEFRARAGAMALVTHLDARLRLSQPQREKLTNSIQKIWQTQWQYYLLIMSNNPQYFPQVPNKSVLPHLNDAQAEQWKSMQKVDLGFSWHHLKHRAFFRNMKPEIEWFEKQAKDAKGERGARFLIEVFDNVVVRIGEEVEKQGKKPAEEDQKK